MISASAPKSVAEPYQRYLLNAFHKALPYSEVPIKLLIRGKKTADAETT